MGEVTKKESTEVAAPDFGSWGAQSNLDSTDYRVSKVLLMQGSSAMVKDRNNDAQIGEFRNNGSGELLGDMDNGLEFIPFHLVKMVDTEFFNPQTKKWEWESSEDYHPSMHKGLPMSYAKTKRKEVNGKSYFLFYRAYCLLTDDLAEGVKKPFVIDYKNSSRRAGADLGQFMYQDLAGSGKPLASYVIELSAEELSNGSDTWLALTNKLKARESSKEELETAFEFYKLLGDMDTSGVDAEEKSQEQQGNYAKDNQEF